MNQAKHDSSNAPNASVQDDERVDLAVAEAMEEYLRLLETSNSVDRDAFLAKHWDIAGQLSDAIESLDFVTRLTARTVSTDPAEQSPHDLDGGIAGSAEALGDFRILREIGRGGMGVVYEAEQRSLGRNVALKVMPFASLLDPRQIERFRNETRAAAMLRHPNIVSVHSVGCERGVHYYAMDLIEGCSLAEVVSRLKSEANSTATNLSANSSHPDAVDSESADMPKTRDTAEMLDTVPVAQLSTEHSSDLRRYFRSVAKLGMQAAEALHFAHQSGVVHRDIKPSNLILDRMGQVHVADFGLARIETNDSITLTGDLVGTLRYMSPEQVEGHVADERSDVYSLGATLFELTTLHPPFDEENRGQLMRAIVESPAPSAHKRRSEIPRDLATILSKCLQKAPTGRYRTAKECADDLRRFLEHRSITARPTNSLQRLRYFSRRNPALATSIATAFLLMALLAGAMTMLAWNYSKQTQAETARVARAAVEARLQRITRYANEMRLGKIMADERRLVELQDLLLRWVPAADEEDLRGFEWFHLWRYCNDPAVIHTFDHELPTYQVAFVDDDELATSGFSRRARIWPLQAGDRSKPREYLGMDGTVVETLLYDQPGCRIFTTDGMNKVYIWDAETGEQLNVLSPIDGTARGQIDNADSIDLSEDGRFLLLGSGSWDGGAVRVLDLLTEETTLIGEHSSRALAAYGPEGRIIVAGAKSNQIQVFDGVSGDVARTLPTDADGTWAMGISDDKSLIAFGFQTRQGQDFTYHAELWETTNWRRLWSMPAKSAIESIDFSDDGKTLAWGDQHGHVRIVEVDAMGNREFIWPEMKLHTGQVRDLEFSSDRKMLATGSSDGFATVWDVQTLRRDQGAEVDFPTTRFRSYGSCLIDDRCTVATTYRTRGVVFWDGRTGIISNREIPAVETGDWLHIDSASRVGLMSISKGYWPAPDPDDPRRSEIVVWDVKTAKPELLIDDLPPLGTSMTSSSMSPDGRYVATCTHHEGVFIIDTELRSVVSKLPILPCKTLRFSQDSKLLAIGLTDGTAQIVSVPDFSVIESFRLDERLVDSIDISPDGRHVTGVGFDRQVRLYDRRAATSRVFIEKLGAFPTVVRFSPDGERILTGSLDGKLHLWITETGDQVMSWDILANEWPTVSFSPSGEAIVAGGLRSAKVLHAPITEDLRRLSVSALRTQACRNVSKEKW